MVYYVRIAFRVPAHRVAMVARMLCIHQSPSGTVVNGSLDSSHVRAGTTIEYSLAPSIILRWRLLIGTLHGILLSSEIGDVIVGFVAMAVHYEQTLASRSVMLPTVYNPVVVDIMRELFRRMTPVDITVSVRGYTAILSEHPGVWDTVTLEGDFFDGPMHAAAFKTNRLCIERLANHNADSIAHTIELAQMHRLVMDASVPVREYTNSRVAEIRMTADRFCGRFPRLARLCLESAGPLSIDASHCPRLACFFGYVETDDDLVEVLTQIPGLTHCPPCADTGNVCAALAEHAPHLLSHHLAGPMFWHPRTNLAFGAEQPLFAAFFIAVDRRVADGTLAYPDPAALEHTLRSYCKYQWGP